MQKSVESTPSAMTPEPVSAGPSVKGFMLRGVFWNVLATFGTTSIAIMSSILVTRMLSPKDFALAGVAVSIIATLSLLTSSGFSLVIVQRVSPSREEIDSLFWFLVTSALVISMAAAAAAPLFSRLYAEPELSAPMAFLSLSLLFGAAGAIPLARLQREMGFRHIGMIDVTTSLVAAAVGVALAWKGFGFWALIVPPVVVSAMRAMLAFLASHYRPAATFNWTHVRNASRFGLSALGGNLFRHLADNGDYLIMPRFWTSSAFGIYYFAYEKSRQALSILFRQIGNTILPAFSRMQNDRVRLRTAFLIGARNWCLVVYPVYVILVACADPILPMLFGEQWRPAIPVFRTFALFAFVGSPWSLASDAFQAIDRPQTEMFFHLARMLVNLPTLVILGTMGADIMTTAIVIMALWSLSTVAYAHLLHRTLGLSVADVWHYLRVPVGAATGMFITLDVVRTLAARLWSEPAALMVAVVLSTSVFFGVARDPLLRIVGDVVSVIRGPGTAETADD